MFLNTPRNSDFPESHSLEMRAYATTNQTVGATSDVNFNQIHFDNGTYFPLLWVSTVTRIATINPGYAGIYVITMSCYTTITDATTSNGAMTCTISSTQLGELTGATISPVGALTVSTDQIPVPCWCGYLNDRDTIFCTVSGSTIVTNVIKIDGTNGWFHIARIGDMAP